MPYTPSTRHQGPPPAQGRPPYQSKKWSEKQAEEEIREVFGPNYPAAILEVKKDAYNAHIDKVKGYMDRNAKHISTSQLRNIFSRVRNVRDPAGLFALRPKLAYVSGREEKNEAMKTMLYLLDRLIVAVNDQVKLERFKEFMESLVAFHKYWGGKN